MAQDANTTTTVKRPTPKRTPRFVATCIRLGCTHGTQAHGLLCDYHMLDAHYVAHNDRQSAHDAR